MNKKKKFGAGILIVIILAGIGFDQYMKATWDHHIVGNPVAFSLKESDSAFIRENMAPAEAEEFIKSNALEFSKTDGIYYWVNNGNKVLIKSQTVNNDSDLKTQSINSSPTVTIIFTNPDGYGSVKIQKNNNLAVTSSFGGKHRYCWHTPNYVEKRIYEGKIVNIYEGISNIYTPFYRIKSWRRLFCNNISGATVEVKF